MLYIKEQNFAEAYRECLENLLNTKIHSVPSGTSINRTSGTSIVYDAYIEIENPVSNLAYIPGRNFSIVYALNEMIMLFANHNELKYFTKYNKNISKFSDDGLTLSGNYGKRISDKFIKAAEMLKADPYSRQVIIPIYGKEDFNIKSKDIPCTLFLAFRIEEEKLVMEVEMRSNDIIWGTPYDIFNFASIQQVIANELGISCGKYIHKVINLHLYDYDKEKAASLVKEHFVPLDFLLHHKIKDMQNEAKTFVDGINAKGDFNCFKGLCKIFTIEDAYRNSCYSYNFLLDCLYIEYPSLKYFTKRYLQAFHNVV